MCSVLCFFFIFLYFSFFILCCFFLLYVQIITYFILYKFEIHSFIIHLLSQQIVQSLGRSSTCYFLAFCLLVSSQISIIVFLSCPFAPINLNVKLLYSTVGFIYYSRWFLHSHHQALPELRSVVGGLSLPALTLPKSGEVYTVNLTEER